jgi:hypothetical protein
MLRLGGVPTYLSFVLGMVIIVLIVLGYAAVAPSGRRGNGGSAAKVWSWAILACGFICAFNGGIGTITGLVNVHRAALGGMMDAGAVMAEGTFEVLFNVAFGFMFAWLALFGYATTTRLAKPRTS